MGYSLIPLLLVLISCSNTISQDQLKVGKQHIQNRQWEQAEKAFKLLLANEPRKAEAWFFLGLSLHSQQRYRDAIQAYIVADSLEYAPARTRYNMACSYSLLNENGEAIHAIARAMNAGFRQLQLLLTDTDLDNIRNEPAFQELVMQLEQRIYPCIHNPKYSEFDFWVGEWEVFNQQGQKVGENQIQKIMRGCLILENWKSVSGSKGSSMNYYDPSSNSWKQNWIDENGQIIWYSGNVRDNAMHFEGEFIDHEGNVEMANVVLKLLPNGNIHHLIEHSKDSGKTWYTWFDGIYVKKKAGTGDAQE
jgi:tetratricopeptide (TPR) repeat protein